VEWYKVEETSHEVVSRSGIGLMTRSKMEPMTTRSNVESRALAYNRGICERRDSRGHLG
jgi:hypothetical protein